VRNRNKVIGKWRKFHNEELNVMYCLLNVVRVIKSKEIRWLFRASKIIKYICVCYNEKYYNREFL
jgi:hypothetical protein